MTIPYIAEINTAIIAVFAVKETSFLRFPQRIAAVNKPYTVKCPNLSIAIKSKSDSGRFIPAFADKTKITIDHISAGR